MFSKTKRPTAVLLPLSVPPDFASSPTVVLSSSVPFFNHRNMVSLIIRHVNMTNYEPVKRFFTFINISSHIGRILLILYFSACQSRRLVSVTAVDRHMTIPAICLANILESSKF